MQSPHVIDRLVASHREFLAFLNALFAADYPNLPGWITPWIVIATWLAISAIALAWLALRSGARGLGVGLLAVYALFGFDAFGHYGLATIGAHSVAMNVSIWFEGVSAIVLFVGALVHGTELLVQAVLSPAGSQPG